MTKRRPKKRPHLAALAICFLAASTLACRDSAESERHSEEIAKLQMESQALVAEVQQYETTVERLKIEVRTLLAENADLKDRLESVSLELEGAKKQQRPIQFVERIVERPPASSRTNTSANRVSAPSNAIDEETGLQVLEASARAQERNNTWWRFGWVVTIANHSTETKSFKLIVQFMDTDGFVVDDDTEYNLSIPPGGNKTFRETTLVNASVAQRVKSVNPVLKN